MNGRIRIEVLLRALACFAPVIAAYLLYYYGDLDELPHTQNDERQLVSPAVPLPAPPAGAAAAEAGWGPKWSLLYVRKSPCGEPCREHLIRLAQVHAALGRDQNRVRRVYLGPDPEAVRSLDPTRAADSLSGSSTDALLEALESGGTAADGDGRVYVIDPHGNLVLGYPPDAEQRGLLEDLERLLDVSRIG